jgi:hypothetical protein
VQGCSTIFAHSVDVSAEIGDQASYHFQVTHRSSDVQGREAILIGLIDVSSKLIYQAPDNVSLIIADCVA